MKPKTEYAKLVAMTLTRLLGASRLSARVAPRDFGE
jgi:hypothetical protein